MTPPADETDATDCLDEDELLALVSGSSSAASQAARRRLAQHVDGCEACRALAATLAHDDDVRREQPPPNLEAEKRSSSEAAAAFDGRFRLLGKLGRGAMGVVYRAHDGKLGIDVALKVLREDAAAGAGGARAFARELAVGRRVNHPNVCRLYDAGEVEGAPYITMELLEGETLADVLAQRGPSRLDEARARELLEGIAAGLAAVHAEGVVHRDLKPANVMVERTTGRPVLTDFGFATDLRGEQSRRLVGTPAFWAPEQARGEAPTPASDVFSFGLLAYRLLANRDFSLSDPAALSQLPPAWRGFVGRCLEPRPGDRFPDARAICDALRRRSTRASTRTRIALGAAAALALLAAGATFGIGRPTAKPEPAPVATTPAATRLEMAVASAPPEVAAPPAAASEVAPPPSVPPSVAAAPPEKHVSTATVRRTVHPPNGTASARPTEPSALPSAAPPPPPPRNDDPLIRH